MGTMLYGFVGGTVVSLGLTAGVRLSSSVCYPQAIRTPEIRYGGVCNGRKVGYPRRRMVIRASMGITHTQNDSNYTEKSRDEVSSSQAESLADDLGTADEQEASEEGEGLQLTKRDLDSRMGSRAGPVRLRRKSVMAEVGALDLGTVNTPVAVRLAVQPIRGDYRIIGRVATRVTRSCDRCLEQFEAESTGRFEVWLSTVAGGLSEEEELELEAVEEFYGPLAMVDLAPHVRDAIYLSMSTKALCKADCEGVELIASSAGRRKTMKEPGEKLDSSQVDKLENVSPLPKNTVAAASDSVTGQVETEENSSADRASLSALLALKRKFEEHNNRERKNR
jgi:uncharacterized metal-binding protein YceD (DUF177 family)